MLNVTTIAVEYTFLILYVERNIYFTANNLCIHILLALCMPAHNVANVFWLVSDFDKMGIFFYNVNVYWK